MAAPSFSANNKSPLFHQSVDKLFSNWSALQIAVDNGQGGAFGKEIAVWMRGAVENFFYENGDLEADEVAEFVGAMMNQELDTIVEDNSLEDLGNSLCTHFRLAVSRKDLELVELHKALDAAALVVKPKVQVQSGNGDSSSDESADEEMETEDSAGVPSSSSTNQRGGAENSNNHRAGHNLVSEPDEDGWVTVVKNRK